MTPNCPKPADGTENIGKPLVNISLYLVLCGLSIPNPSRHKGISPVSGLELCTALNMKRS